MSVKDIADNGMMWCPRATLLKGFSWQDNHTHYPKTTRLFADQDLQSTKLMREAT